MDNARKKKKVDLAVFIPRVIFCGLILYFVILLISQQFTFGRLSKEEKELEKEIVQAQQDHEALEAEKEASSTWEYIERVAREVLGLAKPDEKVFVDVKKAN